MIYTINKQLILEASLPNEIRYEIKMSDSVFDNIKNVVSPDNRTDWYFNNYRIRLLKDGSKIIRQKINDSSMTLVNKKKQTLSSINTKLMDKTCDFKLHVESKRPVIDGKELYLERVTLYSKNKTVTYITTEVETEEGLKELELLKKLPAKLKKLGVVSMKDIALKHIKDL